LAPIFRAHREEGVVAVRPIVRLVGVLALILGATALWVQPAAANSKKTTAVQADNRFVDSRTCAFDIRVHFFGVYRSTDYYDNSGFLYKTIITAGGGLFTVTEAAKGITLTMQMQTVEVVITYNADGSVNTGTDNGLVLKFTLPGSGVVLLDTGRLIFDSEGDIVFEAGPHQALHGDVEAFCAAFG
jgi:hypothetical protein